MTKTEKRREMILDIITREETNVEALSRRFGVSESSIRRDLAELSNDGCIVRTYGGAALSPTHLPHLTVNQRVATGSAEEKAIARLAATVVQDGDTLILDTGTTTAALATQLVRRRGLHVITNNLMILPLFAADDELAVTVIGGAMSRTSMGTFGPLAELALSRMTADKLFLSAEGLVAGRGLCAANMDRAAFKAKMIGQAGEIFVLADSSKLGFAGHQAWTPLDRPWTLITDRGAGPTQLNPFRALPDVNVLVTEAVLR